MVLVCLYAVSSILTLSLRNRISSVSLFISDTIGKNFSLLSLVPLLLLVFHISESSLSRQETLATPLSSFPALHTQYENVTSRFSSTNSRRPLLG